MSRRHFQCSVAPGRGEQPTKVPGPRRELRRSVSGMRRSVALAACVLLVAACSGSDDGTASSPSTTSTTSTTAATTSTRPADPYFVDTTTGPVQGGPSAVDGVRNFLAIPYAEAPVGDRAWKPPAPRAPWDDPLDATQPGASCPQTTEGVTTAFIITPDPDPDCLTVSVWTPEEADGLPVMVWIHGGGFSTGSAHEPYYAGDDLAARGVVVVNVNYRLGPQGFLATAALQAESGDGSVGNYGFRDQQLALHWVHDNAAAFGGNPARVTIFGESAGGFAVCGHLAAPGSQGLFAQAIVQSGGGCDRLLSLDAALAQGQQFMDQVGCSDLACLRAIPDDRLVSVEGFSPSLAADGVTLSDTAYDLARSGRLGDVPVLIGSNADEATLFTINLDEPSDQGLAELASAFTDDPAALVALYPADRFASNKARYQAMFTDVRFTCPTVDFATVDPDAFVYHYTYVDEANPLGLGATHGSELAALFHHPEGLRVDVEQTERGEQLSDGMQAAWVAFATTGDPGDAFAPYGDGGEVARIDVPIEQVDTIRDGRCDQVIQLSTAAR